MTDRLHVVYRAPGIGIRWARHDAMDWLEETIPSPNDCDGNPAVAVDPELGVHVAWVSVVLDDAGQVFSSYYHRDLVSPRVAIRDGNGVWSIETASALLGAGKANSIALDDNGGAHVVYRRELNSGLYYAYRDPDLQSWAEELITAGGFLNDLGQSAKIEVDGLGDVWDSEVVDDVPPLGRYATMDIDADGGIHVAYQRSNTGTLH